MADSYTQELEFTVDGLPADAFAVFRFSGREAISELFRFEIDVVSDSSHLDLEALAGQNAALTITRLEQTRTIHGMVERIEQHDATPRGQYIYRAILVPRLQRMAYSRQNQIHGTSSPISVREVLLHELTAKELKGPQASAVSGRLGFEDFEMRLTQTYPQRDYIVQYDESDFAFISRLCEHYGIFYFFTHEGGRDVVVFGDARVAFPHVGGSGTIAYRPASGLANAGAAAIYRFVSEVSMVPSQVCLRDYNYRLPSLTLEVDETVDPNGHGVVIEYGSHFRTPQEGRDLARVRAQELASRKTVFTGTGDSVHFTAGSVFDLADHFRSDFNAGYLITWIEHEATQALAGIGEFVGPEHQTSYRNRFACLPKTVEFRPARVTPKPKMPGLSNATVDASGSGQRAEVDASGRYKIRQQFDQRGEAAGQASRYMRKAEPYGGANTGMHFPLLKGTEVVLACVNGDPDRPIIVGAMQNEQYPSIVNSRNNTTNRMQTTSGAMFEIDDGPATGGGGGSGAGSGGALAPQRAFEGSRPGPVATSPVEGPAPVEAAAVPASPAPHRPKTEALAAQRAEADIETTGDSTSSYARLQITSGTAAYWRLGSEPTDTTETAFTPGMSDMTSSAGGGGLFEYTAGDSTSLITGSRYAQVNTNSYDYVQGTRRMSAATHKAVSKGQYQVIAKGVAIQASTGTITDNSAPSDAPNGDVVITSSNDFTVDAGGDSNVTMRGTSFWWFGADDTQFRMGSATTCFLGMESSINLGTSSKTYVGYRSRFWIIYNSNFGIGKDSKVQIGASSAMYIGARSVTGGVGFKADLTEVKAAAAAKIESTLTKLGNALAECYSGNVEAEMMAASCGMGVMARM